jgi:hypothetical protein
MLRTLVIGGLCVILIGCSCPVPPRETAATVPIDLKRVSFKPEPATTTVKPKKVTILTKPAAAKPPSEVRSVGRQTNSRNMDSKALPSKPPATPGPVEKKTTTTMAEKTEGPASGQPSETSDPVLNKGPTIIGGKTEGPVSDQPLEASDPVLKKAKITIAAKLEDPTSAEFVDMKRVLRKNTFGESFEFVCGQVKSKKKSGQTTGAMPFLYLVQGDEAYIVDGNPDSMAAIVYRAHCTSLN